jgi:hypothetical protein
MRLPTPEDAERAIEGLLSELYSERYHGGVKALCETC